MILTTKETLILFRWFQRLFPPLHVSFSHRFKRHSLTTMNYKEKDVSVPFCMQNTFPNKVSFVFLKSIIGLICLICGGLGRWFKWKHSRLTFLMLCFCSWDSLPFWCCLVKIHKKRLKNLVQNLDKQTTENWALTVQRNFMFFMFLCLCRGCRLLLVCQNMKEPVGLFKKWV